jgi:hypothetical protein
MESRPGRNVSKHVAADDRADKGLAAPISVELMALRSVSIPNHAAVENRYAKVGTSTYSVLRKIVQHLSRLVVLM